MLLHDRLKQLRVYHLHSAAIKHDFVESFRVWTIFLLLLQGRLLLLLHLGLSQWLLQRKFKLFIWIWWLSHRLSWLLLRSFQLLIWLLFSSLRLFYIFNPVNFVKDRLHLCFKLRLSFLDEALQPSPQLLALWLSLVLLRLGENWFLVLGDRLCNRFSFLLSLHFLKNPQIRRSFCLNFQNFFLFHPIVL